MRYVGTTQYARMLEAHEFYEERGFDFVNVPWAVGRKAILLTRPPAITGEPFSFVAGGQTFYPVASAEQSFLQMQMDVIASGNRITGSYCAMTPCFRNEPKLDDEHQPYFFKLELISWVAPDDDKLAEQRIALQRMINDANILFQSLARDVGSQFTTNVIQNNELATEDPIGVAGEAYDIVAFRSRIEVGSYGIREHPSVGRWIYGTGLAEPRYSYAMEQEETFEAAVARPA